MTDEEACAAALDRHFDECESYTGDEQRAFDGGFRAGLAHARRWRPLTSYPETWPEDGQLVAVYNIGDGAADADTFQRDALYHKWYTHWLPLPPPSEGVGGG